MKDTTQVATYVISVAAELAGMHPQTLRQYDRMGLVTPARTKGRGRRYTSRDVERLRLIQYLSQEEGVNLAGIKRILDLEERLQQMSDHAEELASQLDAVMQRHNRVFAADSWGDIAQLRPGERVRAHASAKAQARGAHAQVMGELVPASAWGNERLVSLIAALNALGLRPTWARGPRLLEAPRRQAPTIEARSWIG